MTRNAHRGRPNAAGPDQAFGVGVIQIDRILCPISLDGRAADAIDQAARLATLNQAELRLLHVVPPADSQARGHGSMETAAERALADICALARRLPGRVRVSAAVTEGELIEEVVRHARLMKADLVAIATRGGREAAVPALATAAAEARVPILFIDANCVSAGQPADSIVVHTADRDLTVSASCAEAARVAAVSGCPVLLQPSSDHAP